MAGLLDFLSTPESQLGLGLLAAGGSGQRFGPGLLSAVQYVDEQKKDALKQKFMQTQMDNYQSEIDARKLAAIKDARQQAWIERLMGGGQSGQGAGFISSGQGTPAASGGSTGQSVGGIMELARSYGIPEQAIAADMAFNGGKGIAAMLEKRGSPDMQVTNGYAYDKNKLGAGFMPSLSTSQDGKTSMVRIGPDGLPVVMAPQGALDTYNSYQAAQASYKPIKVFNPETQREEFTNEGAVVRGGQPQPSGYAGGSRDAAAQEQIRIMQAELRNPNLPEADKAAVSREISRLQGFSPRSGNYAAGPSASELAQNEASRARAVDTAKADVVRDTNSRAETKKASQFTTGIDQAIELLKQDPTSSSVGAAADKAAAFFGKSTKSADTAARLEAVSGWLVSNVPRMEGPQSNFDVQNYQTMAGLVGDRTKPISTRLAAAQEVKRLQEKYAHLNGKQGGSGGASGSWDGGQQEQSRPQQREFSMLPKASDYDGRRMRAGDGTIYRSVSGKWVKE